MLQSETPVMVSSVDLKRLPVVYAEFLRLKSKGLDDTEIARALGVPVESIPLLARLAVAKLTRLAINNDNNKPTSS